MKKAIRGKHLEPSRASLRAMPELDFRNAKPNPYAKRIAAEGFSVPDAGGRRRSVRAEPEHPLPTLPRWRGGGGDCSPLRGGGGGERK
jgi:hypothetical protein